MLSNPTISIIVPVYKSEKYLPQCIDSILSQTFTHFELILVNDGSPDNSGKICNEYAVKDERIRVIHTVNRGASSARNIALDSAKGKYIGWVDADDRIAHDMFETLYCLAKDYNADIAECQFLMIKGNQIIRSGKDEQVVHGHGDFVLKQFFSAQMKPSLWSKLYRREIWNGIRFPVARKHHDYYVNICFALMPLVYVRTPQPLYFYMVRENSITTTYSSFEIRQAIYLYEYTISLSLTVSSREVKKHLHRDAINRLMGRYFEIITNSNLPQLHVYQHFIKKMLGLSVVKYLLVTNIRLKTKISYALILISFNKLQYLIHRSFGKRI